MKTPARTLPQIHSLLPLPKHTEQAPASGLHTCLFTVWGAFLPRNLQSLFSTPHPHPHSDTTFSVRPVQPLVPSSPLFSPLFSALFTFSVFITFSHNLFVSSPHLVRMEAPREKGYLPFPLTAGIALSETQHMFHKYLLNKLAQIINTTYQRCIIISLMFPGFWEVKKKTTL